MQHCPSSSFSLLKKGLDHILQWPVAPCALWRCSNSLTMTPFYYYYDTHTPDINDIISLDDSMQAKTASGSWEILSDDGGADHITLSELRRNVEFEEKHLYLSNTISLMVSDHCLLDFIKISCLLLISDISPQFWHFAKPVKNGQFWRPKKLIWGPKKKVIFWNHIDMCFLQKNGFNLVKFGLCGSIYILHPAIGGSHSVPCLSTQLAERQGTAMY